MIKHVASVLFPIFVLWFFYDPSKGATVGPFTDEASCTTTASSVTKRAECWSVESSAPSGVGPCFWVPQFGWLCGPGAKPNS